MAQRCSQATFCSAHTKGRGNLKFWQNASLQKDYKQQKNFSITGKKLGFKGLSI